MRQKQGAVHGFLLIRNADGKVIATGDQVSIVHGQEIHSRLTFRFKDGSLDDETTVFRQGSVFQLISDHHIQKGPSFPKPVNVHLDARSGEVTYTEFKDGRTETKSEHMDLPSDLSNGLIAVAVQCFRPGASEMKVSYLSPGPKPRVITLSIKPDDRDSFQIGETQRRSDRFSIHVELGGVAGVIAPIIGKQPSDFVAWTAAGEVPTFLRMQGALYDQGPIWTMEVTGPVWSQTRN